MAKGKTEKSNKKASPKKLQYKTDVDVHQMVINKSVMSLKVPTILAQKEAQGLLTKAIDDGITPYYLRQETIERLGGIGHHE
ncbi:hypothetical protein [Lentilactobacillus otakiensis]|uniref:Uncharacterized protein n=1 Tax=Lentilactobacillus otakiensis DSM 19908 = JCM 15040 TaxID=1423780 RepID=S4NDM2_9LACO|nr:hypothetical protein [Lentilactobacillus otakiensis]KRL11414.1 hypothetical protein FD05_GL002046 [Lentilactobacillus otakiensis DSM 19908 = JCM 15040]MBZ3776962.1 hypothetical protein [Lentilactobacillus otakiensis]MDV3517882.1 hypothetical protein [Lentilactobacillus otakiensis]GAD16994.1 hypothetical protein LOT_1532 [Lentilactobacillus otakiensis DSM 19908 = JCM 15040]